MTSPATAVLSCRVLQDLLEPLLPDEAEVTYLDSGLHTRPVEMAPTLQRHLDALPEPSTVLVGYGLCGNGVVGVESGPHTLVFPRTHDCIGMMLGSQQRYEEEFYAEPGTYYLTRGWLESGDDPLTTYHRYEEDYGTVRAERLIDKIYGSYRRLRVIAFSEEEMERSRQLAAPVAQFCRDRWGMAYDEYLGDPTLLEKLIGAADVDDPDLLVVPPGTTVTQEMFLKDEDLPLRSG